MGKKKFGWKGKNPPSGMRPTVNMDAGDDDDGYIDSHSAMYDQVDDFHDDREKILLQQGHKTKTKLVDDKVGFFDVGSSEEDSEAEGELFPDLKRGEQGYDSDDHVPHPDDDMDEEEEENDSDIEGKGLPEVYIPDEKAWGDKKHLYYKTDFVDQDWRSAYNEEDAEKAKLEYEEVQSLQKKMADRLDDEDYEFPLFAEEKSEVEEGKVETEKIQRDLTKLSNKEKLELIKKESPELTGLIQDYKDKSELFSRELSPLLELVHSKQIPDGVAADYVKTKSLIILNYLNNLNLYFLLKSKRVSVRHHPIMKRLLNYRNLLKELEPADLAAKPQVDRVLTALQQQPTLHTATDTTLQRMETKQQKHVDKLEKKSKLRTKEKNKKKSEVVEEGAEKEEVGGGGDPAADERRAITKQIAANKGLTPYQNKKLKNPRVRHKHKFKKALIRQKGMFRTPRTETERYGGEIRGIRSGVVRSVKIK